MMYLRTSSTLQQRVMLQSTDTVPNHGFARDHLDRNMLGLLWEKPYDSTIPYECLPLTSDQKEAIVFMDET